MKDRLVYLAAEPTDSDNVGAFVKAGTDGTAIDHTGSSLNVNVTNSVITNGAYAEDSAVVSGDIVVGAGVQRHDANTSTVSADGDYSHMHVNAFGGLKAAIMSAAGIDLAISAAGEAGAILSSTSGVFAEDAAHTSGDKGMFALAVRNDAAATALTSANGDYSGIAVDAQGRVFVNAEFTSTADFVYAEDTASADGEQIAIVGGVRQDTLAASTSADGDHAWLKVNNRGGMWSVPVGNVDDDAADSEFPVKIGSRADSVLSAVADADRANVISDLFRRVRVNDAPDIAVLQSQEDVDNVAEVLMGTALAGRKKLFVQNLSTSRDLYVGATGVTALDGFRISRNSTWEFEAGPNIALYAISTSATVVDTRILELA